MFRIGKKRIGGNNPCFIIAECGINHNGNIDTAMDMVDAAKKCRADAVKFQTVDPEHFKGKENYKVFKKCKFSYSNWKALSNYCQKKNIIFFSTPQTIDDLKILLKLNVPVIKISSDNITNIPLIEECAKAKLPVIISTGLGNEKQIKKAVQTIRNNDNVALLHCVSKYPTSIDNINLPRIKWLRDRYPSCVVGFSDHSKNVHIGNVAISLGTKIYEKHFTLDNNMKGLDHKFSLNPSKFSSMVRGMRRMEKMLEAIEWTK